MSDKKRLGQFFTDPVIADFMVRNAIFDGGTDFLDPAAGPGIFALSAKIINPHLNIDCYEIDTKMIDEYNDNICFKTNLYHEDYLYSIDKKYDSIVCNPPYNKFQEISDRKELVCLFSQKYNIKLKGYTNYCMYFLIKALNSLKENGRCVFIVPYEFMNTGYGIVIKDYILNKRMLKSLIRFDNNLNLFDDAITTSCIMIFENLNHDSIDFINIKDICDLNYMLEGNYDDIKHFVYDYGFIKSDEKWLRYFGEETNIYHNLIYFSDVACIKRGIATGNNGYFSLSMSDIIDNNLSNDVCIPCVTRAPDVNELIMSEEYFKELTSLNRKMFIFDGRRKSSSYDEDYIRYGEMIGVNNSYINSHKNPWYRIEDREPAPIWISVFSRGKIKVVRNEILIHNLTTFHGVYVNNDYKDYIDILFCYLQSSVGQEILKLNKREYGNGLDKFEPNDINNAFILDLSVIDKGDIDIIYGIYNDYKKTKKLDVSYLNEIFSKYIYGDI